MKSIENLIVHLKELEEKLQVANQVNKTLSEYTYDWEYWLGNDKKFKYISPSCFRISGFSRDEFILNPELFLNQIIDEDKDLWLAHEKDTSRQIHCKKPLEFRFKTKSGSIIHIEHICRPVFSNSNEFWGYRGINKDITATKQNERKILSAIIQTEEKERRRIAQDLHDGLGPVVSAAKMCFETYLSSTDKDFNKQLEQQVLVSMNDALEQISVISNNLSPHVLNDFGLEVAVRKFAKAALKATNIKLKLDFQSNILLNPNIEISLYRTITELINNTVKHAKASEIAIKFFSEKQYLVLEFKNNGKWFNFKKSKELNSGMGLYNLTNRIESLNGTVKFGNEASMGVKYNIIIPQN